MSILSERRALRPYGLLGGHAALPGLNLLIKPDGRTVNLGAKNSTQVEAGDRVRIYTPGALQRHSIVFILLLTAIQHRQMYSQQYGIHVYTAMSCAGACHRNVEQLAHVTEM